MDWEDVLPSASVHCMAYDEVSALLQYNTSSAHPKHPACEGAFKAAYQDHVSIRLYLAGKHSGEQAQEPVSGDEGHVAVQSSQMRAQLWELSCHQLLQSHSLSK